MIFLVNKEKNSLLSSNDDSEDVLLHRNLFPKKRIISVWC